MNKQLTLSQKQIENQIYSVRGVQVMIDRDLAQLYEVETRVLNQAVKRNNERFPEAFRFQLNEAEFKNWKSQIVMSNEDKKGLRRPPYVFTEQGVAMLSAVLRSETAINVSIQIINAFVEMRKIIVNYSGLSQRMEGIEKKQLEADRKFVQIFKALESKDVIPNQGVFFDGQVFDAYGLASKIIRSAQQSIVLIDNYMDETTLTHLCKKRKGVNVVLLTKNLSKQLALDIKKANEQYPNIKAQTFAHSHDRFLMIDGKEIFHLGASLKDLGKKWFAFSKMDRKSVDTIVSQIPGLIKE